MKRVITIAASLALIACASASLTGTSPRAPLVPAPRVPDLVEDDFDGARAQAMARGALLVVDLWARWCPPCVGMRAFALRDATLGALLLPVVWASLDVEAGRGAPYAAAHPPRVLPTLLVLDPVTTQPLLVWEGTIAAPVLAAALEAIATARAARPDDARSAAERMFASGARALVDGEIAVATRQWEEVLSTLQPAPPLRDATIAALSMAYERDAATCIAFVRREALARPDDLALASEGLDCAKEVGQDVWRDPVIDVWIATVSRTIDLPSSADPYARSSAYRRASSILRARGDLAAATAFTRRWLAALDRSYGATDALGQLALAPEYRAAYSALGELPRAVEKYMSSEHDAPDDYAPSFDLARTLLDLRRYDEASRACARAEAKAPWPRRIEMMELDARILRARGDVAAERATLPRALHEIDARIVPVGWYAELVASMRARLATMG